MFFLSSCTEKNIWSEVNMYRNAMLDKEELELNTIKKKRKRFGKRNTCFWLYVKVYKHILT